MAPPWEGKPPWRGSHPGRGSPPRRGSPPGREAPLGRGTSPGKGSPPGKRSPVEGKPSREEKPSWGGEAPVERGSPGGGEALWEGELFGQSPRTAARAPEKAPWEKTDFAVGKGMIFSGLSGGRGAGAPAGGEGHSPAGTAAGSKALPPRCAPSAAVCRKVCFPCGQWRDCVGPAVRGSAGQALPARRGRAGDAPRKKRPLLSPGSARQGAALPRPPAVRRDAGKGGGGGCAKPHKKRDGAGKAPVPPAR